MSPPPTASTPRIALALVLGWLLPGLGHALYGRKDKALYFGFLVLAAFAIGLVLGEARVIHAEKFALYLAAQIWNGAPTLLTLALTKNLRIDHDIAGLDLGLLFTSVAGLLNVVVLVDLYEIHLKCRAQPAAPDAAVAGASRT